MIYISRCKDSTSTISSRVEEEENEDEDEHGNNLEITFMHILHHKSN